MYSVKIKVNKNVVRLVSLILLTILIIPIFRTVIPFVLLLYSIDLFLIFTKKDKWAIYFFIMCCIMQNLVCIIFSEYLSSFETQLIVFVKELLVYGFVFVRAFKNICGYKRIRNIDIVALLFVIISLMYMFFSSVSFTAQILGWRQLAVPIMCFYFGNFASIKYEEVKDIFHFIIRVTVLLSVIGIIMYFLPNKIWDYMGYQQFWRNKTGTNGIVTYSNFYTYDLVNIFGRLKRMVSITADPLATVHLLSIGLILMYFNRKQYYMSKLFVIIGIVLGVSKGSLVIIVTTILVYIYCCKSTKLLKKFLWVVGVCTVVVFNSHMNECVDGLTVNTAVGNHYSSFRYGLENMTLFGNGLGMAGYTASAMGSVIVEKEYSESFFAVLSAQLGLVGVLLLYGFLSMICFNMAKEYKKTKEISYVLGIACIFSIMLESVVSSSSISMLGSGVFFVVAGLINRCNFVEEE